ncbi:hypothetical protein KXQ82_10875 [Mucilaginibacter sp. HMF5004]|uniref:hypothetical protein n=1 Tax=Mucilaginibacter rivuli TaxID=2857527 RepID=UPI001C5D7BCE|nr:hypothetical protein [Mucilaginibacter rivuli]MBW4890224.1 hypothetical protein [Mucilaginibacter rivuli]
MKLFLAIDYLRHRISAKNRHGLHSPYIYKLLDEIVYDFTDKPAYNEIESATRNTPPNNTRPNSQKVNRLLYRLLQYFNPATLAVADNVNNATRQYLQQAIPNTQQINWGQLSTQSTECLICDAGNTIIPETLKPGTIIIATNIYADAAARQCWEQLKTHPNINVTADLFYLGLAFNRPQQADEHFKLKF